MSDIPLPLALTQRWAVRAVAVAYLILAVIAAVLYPVGEWLPQAAIGAFMFPASYAIVRMLLRFQRMNVTLLTETSFQRILWVFFGIGAIWAILVIVGLAVSLLQAVPLGFGISMSGGFCLAAANSWSDAAYFRKA